MRGSTTTGGRAFTASGIFFPHVNAGTATGVLPHEDVGGRRLPSERTTRVTESEYTGREGELRMRAPRRSSTRPAFDLRRAFDDNGHALLGFAVNALRDRPLAEDCVQETFLRAWRARDRFDARAASERTWLFSIARNVIVDALRARARLPVIGDQGELESRAAEAIDPLDRLRMLEALSVLSEAHRTAVVAIHLHGRSYQELADATGVPVATWRTRTFHGLRALRTHLEEMEETDAHSR